MKQEQFNDAIAKLERDHAAGEITLMQTVNYLYDLERDHNLPYKEIAALVQNEDVRDNFLDIQRPKKSLK